MSIIGGAIATIPTPWITQVTSLLQQATYGRWLAYAKARDEGGVDITLPPGTPLYALGSGPIVGAGNFTHSDGSPGYGVVAIRVNVPGIGNEDLYYQHINIASGIKKGGSVSKGDIIGYQRSDTNIELGFNAGWCCVWGDPKQHPGPWPDDPRPWLYALLGSSGSNQATGFTNISSRPTAFFESVSTSVHDTLNNVPGFKGIVDALDQAETFQPFTLPDNSGIIGHIPVIGEIVKTATLPADAMQALLTFITANAMAAFIRLLLVFIGLIIIVS